MTVKNDGWIAKMALEHRMIEPFEPSQVRYKIRSAGYENSEKIISYGLSSFGYDVRLANDFRLFTNLHSGIIDPKNFDERFLVSLTGDEIIIPPNSFALARSVEYFRIPRDVITVCVGKSTWARVGLVANVTAFEPEWEGHVTIELSNTAPAPLKIYAGEGIVQVLFFQSDQPCNCSYKDKAGKYQGQTGITLARV